MAQAAMALATPAAPVLRRLNWRFVPTTLATLCFMVGAVPETGSRTMPFDSFAEHSPQRAREESVGTTPHPASPLKPPLNRWSTVFFAKGVALARTGGWLDGGLIALTLVIFGLDVDLPLGVAPEFLYPAIVYFSLWSVRRRFPVWMTLSCTGLIFLGSVLSPPGSTIWIDLANRFLGAVLLWMTLELGLAGREAREALERSHAGLEVQVQRRTHELSQAIDSLQSELVCRTQAERLLAESREQYRRLFDHAPYPMFIVDLETLGFLDVNQTTVRHYGYSRDEFLAMTIKDIRPLEDVPRLLQALPSVVDSPRIEGPWRHRKKDGSVIDVELGVYSFDDAGRKARLAIVNDITDSQRATERLKESEERFRRVFDDAPIGMGIVGTDGRFVKVNEAFCQLIGFSREELSEKTFREITHPDDLDEDVKLVREVLSGNRRSYQLEKRYLTKTGGMIWGHLTVTILREGEGKPLHLLGMIKDISERKRAEATRTRLLNKILMAQEEERRHIARELHDGIGQTLTALAVGLRSLEAVDCGTDRVPEIRRLRKVAADAVDEARRIARGLRPSLLDDLGLAEALRQYTQDYAASFGISADLHVGRWVPQRLPSVVEIALYRIIQEAMMNTAKHAAARHVSVVLDRKGSMVEAVIEDDGRGFEMDNERVIGGAGLGIQGMRERATLLGGRVDIETSLGKGTAVYVHISLKEASQ